jgi:NADH dehydrogenase
MTDAAHGTVVVVGATGFVGRHVVAQLERSAYHVRAISRDGRRLAAWGSSVEAHAGDVESGSGLLDALRGADAAVSLVAIPRERGGRTFEAVNVGGVGHLLEAMRATGVRRIVHLSVLGVADDPRLRYLSSKWRGEALVRESGLSWIVLRPSLLFGEGDGFFRLIRTTLTWWSPGVVAIPGDGMTRFQPLSVEDLALAVERCIAESQRDGSVYEIGGPAHLTYREIVDAVMQATGKRRLKLSLPMPLISALTAATDRLVPFFPVSHDQIASMSRPNYTEPDAFARAFGQPARPFDVAYLGRR